MTLPPLFSSRRSIRRFTDQPVPAPLIEQLLTAAIWAPSAHNRQPWRFCVVSGDVARRDLARAMNDRLRHDLSRDGVPDEQIEQDVSRSYARLTGAQALIVVCLTMADMDRYDDPLRSQCEHTMAVQSAAMAGQNLLLAAHELGLGTCWMCAPLFCPEVVADQLRLPADWEPQGLIALGYPAETRDKTRRPLADVTLWR